MLPSPVKRALRLGVPGVCAKENHPLGLGGWIGQESSTTARRISRQIFRDVSRKNETEENYDANAIPA